MRFAVLDFETTGNQPNDEIIQIGLVILGHDLRLEREYHTLVRPTVTIPEFITQLTGIGNDDVGDAPDLDEAMTGLVPLLSDVVLVGHNVAFDYQFLRQALEQTGYLPFTGRILDTIELLRILFPSLSSYQLGSVAHEFGVSHDRPHQADSDAMATADVFVRCLQAIDYLPLLTLQRIVDVFGDQEERDLKWMLVEKLKERERDVSDWEEKDSYFPYRQFTLKQGDWTDTLPPREGSGSNPLDKVSFRGFMDEVRSNLANLLPNYEPREAQEQMFNEVMECQEQDLHLLIEAGTGTGKSLGYLLPSLYYSVSQEKKVIVSTHTINLQEQLRQRDLPLLEKIVPFSFKASVLKGRSHYLCLRKFEHKINHREFVHARDDSITAAQFLVWLSQTEHGDDEELHLVHKGPDFWDTVSSDSDSCLNRACPWFRRCFYHRAKNEANLSDIIITNHSLLFTDVIAEHRLLPSYEHLVIDEAHHFEETAGKHLGIHLQYFSLIHPLTRLFKDSKNGALVLLQMRLRLSGHEKALIWAEGIDKLLTQIVDVKEQWDRLNEALFQLLPPTENGQSEAAGQTVYRLPSGERPEAWAGIAELESDIHVRLSDIVRSGEKLANEWKDYDDEEIQGVVVDVTGLFKEMGIVRDEFRNFMQGKDPETVYWMEGNSQYKHKSMHMYAVPVDVSDALKRYFFEPKKSVILTSATLSVDKSFQFVAEQIGLKDAERDGRLHTVILPSPFNYREQALVVIPRDFPSVKGATDARFNQMLTQSIADVAQVTRGRMLVLFTSYRMLRDVYTPLKEALSVYGIHVLGQGIDSGNRSKLTRRFMEQSASVLLGTSSFWEGVDIPGDALTCLAIVRLPFQPPNHPLVEAKSERLKRQNQNPFRKYSVPQAVIRFKQGFGRLVRTSKDKGIVIIYDTRVIETSYGKHFLYSLPGPKMEHMAAEQLVPRIETWLNDNQKTLKSDEGT
ncbi:ATP-dependent DNA helicase DinG [Paenibacillus apiarius]|uniref:3'-5' exonuclease DinG n=1 Tax=Paenibacillus apiarius TaxID=46240 RepID=A0ABT4DTP1_9BACL|nr:ATP-dependent DNA helicase DinG [Paenibacillus apiarius]MCY9515812.1 ATP-dependent DNA helicase DinG [Paenibacillus apiarius]MCY9520722.1 ATP-dependent DNA helicase DinG [Paenibacillus apiarius]MCY9553426.1 ATP-dependent DNA helicase DinG [Paenibacillus apiarius]MCY9558050.1 ATP-dependent DNA helicase DinG [Paenibacillus apiarius]MCY9685905.1 ATP-dependent DNA helicase DinG [Paenibacillus apiarius]